MEYIWMPGWVVKDTENRTKMGEFYGHHHYLLCIRAPINLGYDPWALTLAPRAHEA